MITKTRPVPTFLLLAGLAAATSAQAQSTAASPNQFGDRQTGAFGDRQAGKFGDINQGAFGDTSEGAFAENRFSREQEGKMKAVTAVPLKRAGATAPPPNQSPYVTLPAPADTAAPTKR